ncbi:hypothetical protein HY414_02120 [Candidatus Kaiserbacteria bacterium]|nr:hypothetical protein [Candidatus Kaiserbacteria bacterium]
MNWIRAHPYVATLVATLTVILVGTLVVLNRSGVQPQSTGLRAWGGVGSDLFDPTADVAPGAQTQPDNLYSQVQSGPPFYYAPAAQQLPTASQEDDFDFNAFIATLADSSKASVNIISGSPLDAYSFIPQGLISTSTPARRLSPTQQAIFDYGNEAGSYIQSYEERYRAAPQILKDQFEDREDPEKNAALLSLAGALEDIGFQLEGIEAPSPVSAAHKKVAASYKELGQKLALVPNAKSDQAILDAILSYNAAAEVYVQNYVALATLIGAYGVSFSPEDAGSVFTFSNVSL